MDGCRFGLECVGKVAKLFQINEDGDRELLWNVRGKGKGKGRERERERDREREKERQRERESDQLDRDKERDGRYYYHRRCVTGLAGLGGRGGGVMTGGVTGGGGGVSGGKDKTLVRGYGNGYACYYSSTSTARARGASVVIAFIQKFKI